MLKTRLTKKKLIFSIDVVKPTPKFKNGHREFRSNYTAKVKYLTSDQFSAVTSRRVKKHSKSGEETYFCIMGAPFLGAPLFLFFFKKETYFCIEIKMLKQVGRININLLCAFS